MSEKVLVNYIYDSCYSLEYGDYFLVFDYAEGLLDIPESKHVIFFASDKDGRFFTDDIFNLGKLKSLFYVLNKNISKLKYQDNIIYLDKDEFGMKELKKLYKRDNVYLLGEDKALRLNYGREDVYVKTFSLDGKKLGFLIEIDFLLIFYGGSIDFRKVDGDRYLNLLDELDFEKPDIIFLPITNLDKDSYAYLDKIIHDSSGQILFPTKIGDVEEKSLDFKRLYKDTTTDIRSISKTNENIEIEINRH